MNSDRSRVDSGNRIQPPQLLNMSRRKQQNPKPVVHAVIATTVDPIPGWCPNMYGLNGLMTAVAFGFVRLQRLFCSASVDMICADFVVNSTLAIMWDVCKAKSTVYEIPRPKIFHLTSGTHNPVDMGQFLGQLRNVGHSLATWRTLWYPFSFTLFADRELKWLHVPLSVVPAWLYDRYFRQTLVPGHSMLQMFRLVESYLVRGGRFLRGPPSRFDNNNVLAVYDRMTDFDRETRFPCDVRTLNWKQYLFEFVLGARLYLMREPFETVKTAVKRRRSLRGIGVLGVMAVSAYAYGLRLVM